MAGYPRSDIESDNWQTITPENWSWLDHVKAYGSDAGNALLNLGSNIVEGASPFAPTATQYGKPSLQVPPMLQGIADSYSRLAGTPSQPGNAYNLTGVKELDAPIQQDMSNVLLSLYGGNAAAGLTKPKGALGASALMDTEAQPVRGYHGTGRTIDGTLIPSTAGYYKDGSQFPAVWSTDRPKIASKFAENSDYSGRGANVMPLDIDMSNVKDVQSYFMPPNFSKMDETLKQAKADGYHGVRFKNIVDAPGYYNPFNASNVTAMFEPGNIRSATTGETLFSDTGKPSLLGSALATAGEQRKTLSNVLGTADYDAFRASLEQMPKQHIMEVLDGTISGLKPSMSKAQMLERIDDIQRVKAGFGLKLQALGNRTAG